GVGGAPVHVFAGGDVWLRRTAPGPHHPPPTPAAPELGAPRKNETRVPEPERVNTHAHEPSGKRSRPNRSVESSGSSGVPPGSSRTSRKNSTSSSRLAWASARPISMSLRQNGPSKSR